MQWNRSESKSRALELIDELDEELAATAWYIHSKDPTKEWLEKVMGISQAEYHLGDDEAWIYIWQDKTSANFEPTLCVRFYIDWYAYQGRSGALQLVDQLFDLAKLVQL